MQALKARKINIFPLLVGFSRRRDGILDKYFDSRHNKKESTLNSAAGKGSLADAERTAAMNPVLDHANRPYLKFFEEICAIPHESFHEKAISEYLVNFARERGLRYYTDAVWNVVIWKPASPGCEDLPPVMLQAHTDMVCEKEPGSDFDFDTDPIRVYEEAGWLKARGTSLGADDGYGVAYMLAILDDPDAVHPPLECFFSVQEEVGIGGPRHMDYSQFSARRIINLDGVEEGSTNLLQTTVIGGEWELPLEYETAPKGIYYLLRTENFSAGHASVDIGLGRGNAIKWAVRAVKTLQKKIAETEGCAPAEALRIADLSGGTLRNNIPRSAAILFTTEADPALVRDVIFETERQALAEQAAYDPDLAFFLEAKAAPDAVLTAESSRRALDFLFLLPSGPESMLPCERRVPKASRNLGNVRCEMDLCGGCAAAGRAEGVLRAGYLFRGAYKAQVESLFEEGKLLAEPFGAVYDEEYRYSGYNLNEDWPLVKLWKDVYKEATGKDLYMKYTHGGNDVGTIMEGLRKAAGPDFCGTIEAIGVSPDILHVHTPQEAMDLASFERTYGYLTTILKRLK
ncbi:MAG: aminoacyl-histidine dipeptidase [Clostridiales bacterium]|nr:aminoacyl-histidine dipeptidase [Clostridiales bacterium]